MVSLLAWAEVTGKVLSADVSLGLTIPPVYEYVYLEPFRNLFCRPTSGIGVYGLVSF